MTLEGIGGGVVPTSPPAREATEVIFEVLLVRPKGIEPIFDPL